MRRVITLSVNHLVIVRVEGGLLVKALDCGSKGPGFQSHLQHAEIISLLGELSHTPRSYLRVLWRGH